MSSKLTQQASKLAEPLGMAVLCATVFQETHQRASEAKKLWVYGFWPCTPARLRDELLHVMADKNVIGVHADGDTVQDAVAAIDAKLYRGL